MEYYSSKICKKCYSAQEPSSRFCDNCGKPFSATAATEGDMSIITKTFLKRQVAETRPLFWLCIIIVSMLGVFGFAQAGMYLVGSAASGPTAAQKPVNLASKPASEQAKPPTVPMTNEEIAQPNDTLDLNNSVFEMRAGSTAQTPSPNKRRHFVTNGKTPVEAAKTETVTAQTAEKTDSTAAAKPDASTEKPAESNTAPKKYIRGPMGGCYYINPSGSKRYVDRGLCS